MCGFLVTFTAKTYISHKVCISTTFCLQALEEREKCRCPRLPHLDPRKRVEHFRKLADEVMIHRATRSNLERVSPKSTVIPTYHPVNTSTRSAAVADES